MMTMIRLQWENPLAIIMVLGIGYFLYPLCRALLAGIASARDPSHRATPQSPWHFFDSTVKRRLRWWMVAWLLMACGWCAWVLIMNHRVGYPTFLIYCLKSIDPIFLPLDIVAAISVACFFWVPRCKGTEILMGLSVVSGLAVMTIAGEFFHSILPSKSFYTVRSTVVTGQYVEMSFSFNTFFPIFVAVPICLAAFAVIYRARKSGERWFRFEK